MNNILIKFIGKDGSMGLKNGKCYKVLDLRMITNYSHSMRKYIFNNRKRF